MVVENGCKRGSENSLSRSVIYINYSKLFRTVYSSHCTTPLLLVSSAESARRCSRREITKYPPGLFLLVIRYSTIKME